VTSYWLHNPETESRQGQEGLFFCNTSISALGPTEPPTQGVLKDLSSE